MERQKRHYMEYVDYIFMDLRVVAFLMIYALIYIDLNGFKSNGYPLFSIDSHGFPKTCTRIYLLQPRLNLGSII